MAYFRCGSGGGTNISEVKCLISNRIEEFTNQNIGDYIICVGESNTRFVSGIELIAQIVPQGSAPSGYTNSYLGKIISTTIKLGYSGGRTEFFVIH